MLARDTKSLLIGEAVTQADDDKIRAIVRAHPSVIDIVHLRTMHLGPEEVMAAIKIRFQADMDVRTLEVKINEIEALLRAELPRLRRIYIEPGFDETAGRAEAAR
jgi:divalent metal cation (Fe/Co/Zn/Cd) transporter